MLEERLVWLNCLVMVFKLVLFFCWICLMMGLILLIMVSELRMGWRRRFFCLRVERVERVMVCILIGVFLDLGLGSLVGLGMVVLVFLFLFIIFLVFFFYLGLVLFFFFVIFNVFLFKVVLIFF